ncbi:hypothetical protein [Bradyrhizobium stylosanthis]|uniref:Uncharacterized protein n=1 Tax=Bradyrhizobium stylosanthis TaxID=1803665 RepID=A0A560DZ98_9BRAD|nr:hypothetical protein [Bradyrhizobium stylosanthis]TWB02449.1 hypothetical protein FBZ96_1031231 [Bradyrhizobium stylosanthis]
MKRTKAAALIGAIRLVPDVDTIGVPIFGEIGRGNATFTLEMDPDLRIAEFREFFNEQEYFITYDLPREFVNRRYEVGQPAPILFWLGHNSEIIQGDFTSVYLGSLYGVKLKDNDVLSDLGRLLDDARSGRIKDKHDRWAAEAVIAQFSEVFKQVPVRSRYWVSQYRKAVEQARRLAQPPHPIDSALREAAIDWLRRFGIKSNLRLLVGMLGNSKNGIFSRNEINDAIFAFLLEAFFNEDQPQLEIYLKEPVLHKAFPKGLNGYFEERKYPEVPFPYRKERDFSRKIIRELISTNRRATFSKVENLAFIAYGRSDLPRGLEGEVRQMSSKVEEELGEARYEAEDVFGARLYSSERREVATRLLHLFNQLNQLERVIEGDDRLRGRTYAIRFGLSDDEVERWERIREAGF